MEHNVRTKEFWLNVKAERKRMLSDERMEGFVGYWLCHQSFTFESAWSGIERLEIILLATEFLKSNWIRRIKYRSVRVYDSNYLFYTDKIMLKTCVREAFVNWCIKKFN